jgi:hypothetical protein
MNRYACLPREREPRLVVVDEGSVPCAALFGQVKLCNAEGGRNKKTSLYIPWVLLLLVTVEVLLLPFASHEKKCKTYPTPKTPRTNNILLLLHHPLTTLQA